MERVKAPDTNRDERLKQWIDRYQKMLMRTCFLYLKDTSLAEDAVQETFIKAWKSMDSFGGKSADRTWLTSIAINVCRDMLRGSWFRHTDRSITPDELPEAGYDNTQSRELACAVMNLPKKLREAVILYYYIGTDTTEAARMLGITQAAFSLRLKKARKLLKNELEEGGTDG